MSNSITVRFVDRRQCTPCRTYADFPRSSATRNDERAYNLKFKKYVRNEYRFAHVSLSRTYNTHARAHVYLYNLKHTTVTSRRYNGSDVRPKT